MRAWSLLAIFACPFVWAQSIPISGDAVPGLGAFDQLMVNNMIKHGIPGAALGVARDGRLVYLRGFGYADKDAGTPVQPDSIFRIASVTKPIVAAAAMKAIEQGKLTLATKAFTVLSALQPPPGSTVDSRLAQITVQHLLEHKGGWDIAQLGFDPMFDVVRAANTVGVTPPATCEVVIRYMMGKPLSFTPGAASAYSNFGYCVLGRVLEQVTGQSLETYVRDQVMAPAGATNTRIGGTLLSERVPGEVNYYMEPGSGLASSVFPPHASVPLPYGGFYMLAHNGGGGWISTTRDLLKYVNSMAGFRLPSAILSSPPPGFVGYIPPRGTGWGWIFHGSLPGNQSGLILNDRTSYCWLTNLRRNDSALNDQFFADFDNGLATAAAGVFSWPGGDLFGSLPACSFSLNPSSAAISSTGGGGSIEFTAPSHCERAATSNASWLTISQGATGLGGGTLSYSVQANLGSASRAAALTIGDKQFQVTQQGACGSGTCPFGGPTITAPSPGQAIGVSGVTFQWTPIVSAAGYNLRAVRNGGVVFEGNLLGSGATSTLVSLPDGAYTFAVRGCASALFADSVCGAFSSVAFTVSQAAPSAAPSIASPTAGQNFTSSTQTFSWTSVSNVNSYQVELRDHANGGAVELSLANSGNPPATSTVYSMHSSSNYGLRVRACQSACGPWSATVNFSVTLPPVPTATPAAPACSLSGNRLNCSWNSVANADFYTIHAIHPTAFNGGSLTVASRRTTALSTANPEPAMLVPDGPLGIIVAGCNGNGCGPYSSAANVNAAAGNPASPVLGNPVSGSVVSSNPVFFSWNRIPGDNGSNTVYRLYVQDFSRAAPALDVLTTSNFHAAAFRGEGSRYDAVVIANPDLASQAVGPPAGFIVTATSPASPTMVQPRHQTPSVNAAIASGNVTLGWTPVPGATLYEYFVAVPGQPNASARGVTPGLLVQVPLSAGATTTFNGIVRACPAGAACALGSDAGWGPWSNAPGGPGITSFAVRP